ncbi:MAG: hypothetical protein K0R67_1970 [Paenibacillus sp.]|nr:hypothetical protein [Paenibacillus sp.]
MITHYAEVTLPTSSIQGVKLFYVSQLGFTIVSESAGSIVIRVNGHTHLTFVAGHDKLAPVHLAFEVPMSAFDQTVDYLRQQCGLPLAWPSGTAVTQFSNGVAIYYKDGDGNLLEWIAHQVIREDVLMPEGPLQVMYLREVGFPVPNVTETVTWFKSTLEMAALKSDDKITFVSGGTVYAVVVDVNRKWIPIDMTAIPPRIKVAFGTPDQDYIQRVASRLDQLHTPYMLTGTGITWEFDPYIIEIRFSPAFKRSWLERLNLPAST